MKFLTSIILTGLVAFAAGLYLPWWSIAVAAFIVAAMVHQKPGKAFLSGFLGLFLLWGGLAFWIDMKNNGVLSKKVSALMKLGESSLSIIFAAAFIGALVAGFAALAGSYLRATAKK